MEAVCASETSVYSETTQCYIPEDSILHTCCCENLKSQVYVWLDETTFCTVQAQVIPWLLAAHRTQTQYWPHDVCVSAPTGSGKTLAFVIPIVQVIAVGSDVNKSFVALYSLKSFQNFCDPIKFTLGCISLLLYSVDSVSICFVCIFCTNLLISVTINNRHFVLREISGLGVRH
jgi:hypothetical protein